MKMISAAKILGDFGPGTSPALRKKAGITVKGCPLSTLLFRLIESGYATKKNSPKGNVYGLTSDGKKWIAENADQIETVDQINNTDFGTKSGNAAINQKVSKSAGVAMDGVALLINTNNEAMSLLRGIHIQIGNFLQEHGELED